MSGLIPINGKKIAMSTKVDQAKIARDGFQAIMSLLYLTHNDEDIERILEMELMHLIHG